MRILIYVLGGLMGVGVLAAVMLNCGPDVRGDIAVITHGEEVDLEGHLVSGKYTVFDFYAVWCPPCRILSPALERLAEQNPGELAIRKVDIVDWTQPVAEQHGIRSLPYLILFDPEGGPVAEGDEVFAALGSAFGESAREIVELAGIGSAAPP